MLWKVVYCIVGSDWVGGRSPPSREPVLCIKRYIASSFSRRRRPSSFTKYVAVSLRRAAPRPANQPGFSFPCNTLACSVGGEEGVTSFTAGGRTSAADFSLLPLPFRFAAALPPSQRRGRKCSFSCDLPPPLPLTPKQSRERRSPSPVSCVGVWGALEQQDLLRDNSSLNVDGVCLHAGQNDRANEGDETCFE